MKLRFGIDETVHARMRDALDAMAAEPPVGRRLSYVYLDTPDDALAAHGVFYRFRRSAAAGAAAPARPWRRQMLWPKGGPASMKALGIARLRQRVDATFTIRIERWTWIATDWADVSIDRIAIDAGRASETTCEMRVRCRRRHREAAMAFAVTLGATHLVSRRARDRGLALVGGIASPV